MKEKEISQAELARRIGKSRAYVSKIMNYSPNLTVRSLAMIAMALGLRWSRPRLVEKDSVDRLDNNYFASKQPTSTRGSLAAVKSRRRTTKVIHE